MIKVSLPKDFNEEEYLELNPDVRAAGANATEHYLHFGHKEKRIYKKLAAPLRPKLDSRYDFDGLVSTHNHDFMADESFKSAYARGVRACGTDYKWYWRVHIGLWAARSAIRVEGDFIECGVNRGFLSSAIMADLKWDTTGRTFYLLDTFNGLDERFVSEIEKNGGVLDRNRVDLESGFYTTNLDLVKENFSEWNNIKIIAGSIPETLNLVDSNKVAFLHIDLNCSPPEVAAIESMWDRIAVGGIVLLDDYAYYGFQPQKEGMDAWSSRSKAPIVSLPTGQGIIIKA